MAIIEAGAVLVDLAMPGLASLVATGEARERERVTGVALIPQRRKNRQNHSWQVRGELREYRKRIETTNAQLAKLGLQ